MAAPNKMEADEQRSGAFMRLRSTQVRIEEGDMHAGLIELRAELDELAPLIISTDAIGRLAQAHAILRGLIEKEGER